MSSESQLVGSACEAGFLSCPLRRAVALVALFVLALGLRFYNIQAPPVSHHNTRQFRGALIARAYYFEKAENIPDWRRKVARENFHRQGMLEPPVLERTAAALYGLLGREALCLPRALSAVFWTLGGIFLYLIARRLAAPGAAALATAFYLLLPFAVTLSRNFQPDPLMVFLMLAGLWLIVRSHESAEWRRVVSAVALCAAAVFVKPICVFTLVGAFIALSVSRRGALRGLFSPRVALFAVLVLFPAAAYYLRGIAGGESLTSQARMSFTPGLWLQPLFWVGWAENALAAVGFAGLLAGLAGIVLAPRGAARALIVGLWAAYVLFALAFSYHIHTHDYYQLQLVVIVALGLAAVADALLRLPAMRRAWVGWAALALAALASVVLVHQASWVDTADVRRQVDTARKIGEEVNHSTRTVLLNCGQATQLQYYGEFSATLWPRRRDLDSPWFRMPGAKDARERFAKLCETQPPDYFIITHPEFFREQPDLVALLEHFPVLDAGEDYVIYDLRGCAPLP